MFTAEQLKMEYIEIRDLYYKKQEEIAALRQAICDAADKASRLSDWMEEIERRYDSEYGCDAGKGIYCLHTLVEKEEETSD